MQLNLALFLLTPNITLLLQLKKKLLQKRAAADKKDNMFFAPKKPTAPMSKFQTSKNF